MDGVKALKQSLQKHFTKEKLIFIIGVLKDKEYDKMMQVLCPLAAKVFTVTPDNPRGLPGEVLRESVLPYCDDVTVCGSVDEALSKAKWEYRQFGKQGENAAIVAWGSLSYIGRI